MSLEYVPKYTYIHIQIEEYIRLSIFLFSYVNCVITVRVWQCTLDSLLYYISTLHNDCMRCPHMSSKTQAAKYHIRSAGNCRRTKHRNLAFRWLQKRWW